MRLIDFGMDHDKVDVGLSPGMYTDIDLSGILTVCTTLLELESLFAVLLIWLCLLSVNFLELLNTTNEYLS